ncbi:uncharacterized protein DSM5745_01769 [Aspergillus mulundensis]|uniref:G domain-containing protein n=1 Tax=Aspergillus mulundensis TaxID=1810919 RepID=A0A3D8SUQ0_9EURO|nr:Uncharacterized protein DSM5745_01769 [Aspergillus mulundensis]RDW89994.1 Uncharacterized protein DSM5745_01769 [Aspergillus mulundensis]
MAPDASETTARTKRCLQSIKSHDGPPARVIFIFGKEGVGKSSLTEKITQVPGLAGPGAGTETCQIVDTEINSTKYFIVDTPGLHDKASQRHISHNIAETFAQIRGHAVIAGILFVTPINTFTRRPDELEQRLYAWLTTLCGESFFPHLTFVTTFWEGRVKAYNERLQARKRAEWAGFLLRGARTYQFGKKHVYGMEMEELLRWDVDAEALGSHAREMVVRHCRNDGGGESAVEPLFLQELNAGVRLDATSAARVFRPELLTRSCTSQGSSASGDAEPAEQQEAGTSGSTGASSATPTQPAEGSFVWNLCCAVGRGLGDALVTHGPGLVQSVVERQLGGGGGGGFVLRRNGGLGAMTAQGLDMNLVRGHSQVHGTVVGL